MTWWLAGLALAAAPDEFALCDEQAAWFTTMTRPRPDLRPELWWLERDPPCELGLHLEGEPPPTGRSVACADIKGLLTGPQTSFGQEGKVASQTTWYRNREIGPRFEWDPVTYTLVRQTSLKNGRVHGETIEWLPDGGLLVVTFDRGVRAGPTWRLDERNAVLLVEYWKGGARHGRSCAWHDQSWTEQVWLGGKPAAL